MSYLRTAIAFPAVVAIVGLGACHPTPGPDKSIAGAVLGAGWGAGAGAVIGNQLNDTGPGAALGAGFGAASGLMTGIGLDLAEGTELQQQREIDALKVQVAANQRNLLWLQNSLDDRSRQINSKSVLDQVFFDEGRASLRLGSAAQLERVADAIKRNPFVTMIEVHGHTDETGDVETNARLSEARARSVAGFLVNQGISVDTVKLFAHGAKQPLASNNLESGRQLNRRVELVLLP